MDDNEVTKKIVNKQLEDLMGTEEKTYEYKPYKPYVAPSWGSYGRRGESLYEDEFEAPPKASTFGVPAFRKNQEDRETADQKVAERLVASMIANRGIVPTVARQQPGNILEKVLKILLDYYE